MKTVICYFSGTGNTRRVVNKFVETFCALGHEAEAIQIDKTEMVNLDEYDTVGIAYPIHAFNAPELVLKFVKRLQKAKDKKNAYIIKTSGEPLWLNNISSLKLKSLLKKKNLIVKNEYHYCMPYNIIFRHTDKMAYDMWQTAQQLIPIDCKEILDGKEVKLKNFPFGRFLAWIFRIEYWGGRFNGKRYKVNDDCVKCGRCVLICPTNNITMENGELKFGKKCMMCMRCSFLCHKNAIKIGLFEKWKVNGVYNFNNPNGEEGTHKDYCKKSYKKYFERSQEKIKNNTSNYEDKEVV